MKIKASYLVNLMACRSYVETFEALFPAAEHPDGVEVTEERCVEHHDRFDWTWAAGQLLSSTGYRLFNERAATAVTTARAAQDEREDVLSSIFDRSCVEWFNKWDAHERFSDDAQAEYRTFYAAYRQARDEVPRFEYATYARLFAELSATHAREDLHELDLKLTERAP